MRLYQLPPDGFPDRWASSLQIARMTEAFRDCGVDAVLVFPWVGGMVSWDEVPVTFGLRNPVPRHLLKGSRVSAMFPLRPLRSAALRASLAAFAVSAGPNDVFLARLLSGDPLAMLIALKRRKWLRARLFVELHDARHFTPEVDPFLDGYIVISDALAAFLRSAGVEDSRILVARNGVDLRSYRDLREQDRAVMRAELGLSAEQKIVCYTGQLYPGRNVDAVIAALEHLAPAFTAVIVGGHVSSDVQRLRDLAERTGVSSRVILTGQQTAAVAAKYQVAADVLVIPYDMEHTKNASWCSPLKVGEYLATGRPIAAFPLPSLREMMSGNDVVFAEGETARDLASAIERASRRPSKSTTQIEERLRQSTWSHRAKAIVDFMRR